MPKSGRGGARENAGRRPKPKIEQRADKGIATEVLAMDGPPDHSRKCDCRICEKHPAHCACFTQCGDCSKLKENCTCAKFRAVKIECRICQIVADHKVCHCEVCGWWEALLSRDPRLRKETRVYLTDRREGKPAQGVFVGDTRESALDLDFGNLVMPAAPAGPVKPGAAGKPN